MAGVNSTRRQPVPLRIAFNRSAILNALAWLRRKRAHLPEATIEAFMGQATICCGPLTATVPCSGDWAGVVTFDGDLLRAVAKAAPAGEMVDVRYADGRLYIGGLSAPASWALIAA